MSVLKISLPMYTLPILEPAIGEWLMGIKTHLSEVFPDRSLEIVSDYSGSNLELWRDPKLVISQTCGYPFATQLINSATVIATPCYRAQGCSGGFYRSVVVVHKSNRYKHLNDLHRSIVAVNSSDSYSGAIIWHRLLSKNPDEFFQNAVITEKHINSLIAVSEGKANCAAIDCVVLALVKVHRPDLLNELEILTWSTPAPGLPYITAQADNLKIRNALYLAIQNTSLKSARETLLLDGLEYIRESRYRDLSQYSMWI